MDKQITKCFITAKYYRGINNEIVTKKPLKCIYANEYSSECHIVTQGYRPRKYGPLCYLMMIYCKTHKKICTVYPEGWTPYQRKPWINVPLGYASDDLTNVSITEKYKDTMFEATFDAADNVKWPEGDDSALNNTKAGIYSKTQSRRIKAVAEFFSILPKIDDERRLKTSENFGIPTQYLIDAASRIRAGPTYKRIAQETVALLKTFNLSLSQILTQGTQVKLWKVVRCAFQ